MPQAVALFNGMGGGAAGAIAAVELFGSQTHGGCSWRSHHGTFLDPFKQGVGMTRKHGICVLVGIPPGDFPVPLFDVVADCISIRGSFVGNREDLAEALELRCRG